MPEIILNGPEGRLEGRYQQSATPNAPIALMLHPHPQHGGTMNNKVVYSLYQSFQRQGFSVLRFNFRGVGRSQGVADDPLASSALVGSIRPHVSRPAVPTHVRRTNATAPCSRS